MKLERQQKRLLFTTIQTKPGTGKYIEDHRPEAVRLAKFVNAIQRVPVGTGPNTDDDRLNIRVADMPRVDVAMEVNRGEHNTTTANFDVEGHHYEGQLKHYMVVKHGTSYQFPVKYLYEPGWDAGLRNWIPNDANNNLHRHPDDQRPIRFARRGRGRGRRQVPFDYGARAWQPEGFGGNQDWILGAGIERGNMNLFDSRNATLAHEYGEEARRDGDMGFVFDRSKLFDAGWGVGTLSIASTGEEIRTENHPQGNVRERGQAEMAGTIAIECNDLIRGVLVGDELENAIGALITQERDVLFPMQRLPSPFAKRGGILARLVEMVAEDILTQREQRAAEE